MAKVKIAVIVGSNRRGSINGKLAQALARLGEDRLAFKFVSIGDLPLYSQDLEGELPKNIVRFKSEIAAADALLFVTPEHNRSIPALLKNAIDWGARPYGQNSWSGKPAAITGTSPGAIGAAVAHFHLRQVLGSLGMLVMGGEAYISFKPGLVDSNGIITDERTQGFLKAFIGQFASLALFRFGFHGQRYQEAVAGCGCTVIATGPLWSSGKVLPESCAFRSSFTSANRMSIGTAMWTRPCSVRETISN
jgi:chromate reductase